MKKSILFFFLFCGFLSFANAPQWGKTGHRATAEIAEDYLTEKAKKAIYDLLDGESPALVSTFADEIKSDKKFDEYAVWHYINLEKGESYDDFEDKEKPNIIWAIDKVKKGLKDPAVAKEKKQFYLKMLIHLIGNLHQPLHIGRPDDWGGNKVIVFWFGDASNLHKVWDSEMLDSYKMSYSELAKNQKPLDKKEIKSLQKGNAEEWLKEIVEITDKIYDSAETGYYLSYDYMYDWMPVLREQLQIGGIRLAKELNEIFG